MLYYGTNIGLRKPVTVLAAPLLLLASCGSDVSFSSCCCCRMRHFVSFFSYLFLFHCFVHVAVLSFDLGTVALSRISCTPRTDHEAPLYYSFQVPRNSSPHVRPIVAPFSDVQYGPRGRRECGMVQIMSMPKSQRSCLVRAEKRRSRSKLHKKIT